MSAARIGLGSPFLPPELIAAAGCEPVPLLPDATPGEVEAGRCPYAAGLRASVDRALAVGELELAVLATGCDQLRRAAERTNEGRFLFGMPHTAHNPVARRAYATELARLERRLVRLGGRPADPDRLAACMREHQARRESVLALPAASLPSRRRAELLLAARTSEDPPLPPDPIPAPPGASGVVLLGGELGPADHWIHEALEAAGLRVVLDATGWGERTLPRRYDGRALVTDPREELVDAWFGGLPAVFRRPNDRLFAWLRERIAILARIPHGSTLQLLATCRPEGSGPAPTGLVLVRRPWCDLWRAEEPRLRDWCGLPTICVELGEHAAPERTATRLEALREELR